MSEDRKYRTFTEYKLPSELKKLDFIIESVKEFETTKNTGELNILEIGCGKGNICFPLASLGFNVLGLDLNPEVISFANRRNQFKNLHFQICAAENIECKYKYDIIICSEIFEHMLNPELLSTNLSNLIENDGLLIVTIPNGYGPYELFSDFPIRFIRKLLNKPDPYGHKQNFSLKTFSELLKQFTIIEKAHSDFCSFLPIIRRSNIICKFDCALADILPHYLVSGWYFILKPNKNASGSES
jgi:SAM-dependent methyltransferase